MAVGTCVVCRLLAASFPVSFFFFFFFFSFFLSVPDSTRTEIRQRIGLLGSGFFSYRGTAPGRGSA